MRAAVYARLSRKKADDELGLNISDQQEIGKQLVAHRGWELIPGPTNGTFTDDGRGAYQDDAKRPAWEAMLAAKPDVIIVRDAARLGRNIPDYAALLQTKAKVVEWLDDETADVRRDAEPVSTDTEAFANKTVGNRAYSQKVGRGVRRKVKIKASAGAWPHGGTRAFGYHDHCCRDADGTVRCAQGAVREEEAAIIREFAKRWLAGETLMALTRDLSARGILTPVGKPWQYARLRAMLSGPRIAGIRTHNGVETKGQWEAIVSDELHRRLVTAASESAVRRTGENRSYELSGLIRCSCDNPMYGLTQNIGGTHRVRYVCRGPGGCGKGISGPQTDDYVADNSILAVLAPELRNAEQSRADLADLAEQRRDLESRVEELDRDYWQERTITKDRWLSISSDLAMTLQKVNEQFDSIKANLARQRDLPQTAEELAHRWKKADARGRNRILRSGVEGVIVHPATKSGRFDFRRVEIRFLDGQVLRAD